MILHPLFHHHGNTGELSDDDIHMFDRSATHQDVVSAPHNQWGVLYFAKPDEKNT